MKKSLLIIALAFVAFQQPKTYNFKFTDAQVGQLYDALNRSEAPHVVVQQLQETIQQQWNAQQVKDTIKKK